MIKVTLFKENGKTVRVRAIGHSGMAEHGNDILCAAVSTLVQTTYLAISDIAKSTEYRVDTDSGLFEFDIPRVEDRHDIDVILRAMYLGLKDLSSGYPQNLSLEET